MSAVPKAMYKPLSPATCVIGGIAAGAFFNNSGSASGMTKSTRSVGPQ
jgi:hypothetical protein